LQEVQAGHNRLWHVIHHGDADPGRRNVTWLDGHMEHLGTTAFHRLELRLYRPRP
jgi:prepilin-type processing-associated H-X9-DG protein